jgi:GLPGLI family protein
MGMKTITISTDKEIIMLIDVMGNKSAVRKDVSEETKPSKVEITSEKKNIAGYNCQKAIISNGADDKIIMWVTKSITGGGNWGGTFDKIEGAPMEFSMNNGGINFKMSAISVKEEKINDNLFVIPEGYKEMTEKEIKETLFNK